MADLDKGIKLGNVFAISAMKDNFYDFLLALLHARPLLNKVLHLGDNCNQIFILGGKSALLRSEISFYGAP